MKPLICLVDSDPAARSAVARSLQREGFDVVSRASANRLSGAIRELRPALVVLTGDSKQVDALALLVQMRAANDDTPVIVIGNEAADSIVALDSGADDFILKPALPREVSARAQRILARTGLADYVEPQSRPPLLFNGFTLDYLRRQLLFGDAVVPLGQGQYALLHLFSRMPGRLLSREAIAGELFPGEVARTNSISCTVHRLRKHLARLGNCPEVIQTVHARGYVFRPSFDSPAIPMRN